MEFFLMFFSAAMSCVITVVLSGRAVWSYAVLVVLAFLGLTPLAAMTLGDHPAAFLAVAITGPLVVGLQVGAVVRGLLAVIRWLFRGRETPAAPMAEGPPPPAP